MERIETIVTGGCQCGAVRYRADAVLDSSHICHCRMCQKAVGNFFAALIGISPRTLQNWEQGRREPEGPAKALLRVVDREPQAVLQALHA